MHMNGFTNTRISSKVLERHLALSGQNSNTIHLHCGSLSNQYYTVCHKKRAISNKRLLQRAVHCTDAAIYHRLQSSGVINNLSQSVPHAGTLEQLTGTLTEH